MNQVIGSCAFYTLTYFFFSSLISFPKSLSQAAKNQIRCLFTSLFHSLLYLALSFYSYYSESGISYNQPTTQLQHLIVCVSIIQNKIGYLLYDFFFRYLHELMDLALVVHHICSIIGLIIVLNEEFAGSLMIGNRYAGIFLYAENSAPLLHMRLILKLYGMGKSSYYHICNILFSVI
jgi:hypothetical protein